MISNNPTYTLSIECGPYKPVIGSPYRDASQTITIQLPITCEFEIQRQFWGSSQTATFTLYNLKENTRNLLYHDQYAYLDRANIQFKAGYNGQEVLLFNGWVRWAYSKRPGRDFLTVIEAFDGAHALANSFSSFNALPRTSLKNVLYTLNQDFVSTYKLASTPLFGNIPDNTSFTNLRPLAMYGPTANLLKAFLPMSVSATIDLNQLKVLGYNDVLDLPEILIEAETGLLEPPERSGAMVVAKTLFNPQVQMNQTARLNSVDNSIFNRVYQIRGFSHKGLISFSVGGQRTTTYSLWYGTEALQYIPAPPTLT